MSTGLTTPDILIQTAFEDLAKDDHQNVRNFLVW